MVADDPALEDQADLAVRPAVDLQEAAGHDVQAGLLERLAHGGLARVLAAIEPAAGAAQRTPSRWYVCRTSSTRPSSSRTNAMAPAGKRG